MEKETCEACHVGPNQKRGVHKIDLTFTAPDNEYLGWNGTGLDCLGCHDSNLNGTGTGQGVHSAHPASYNGTKTRCGTCHAGENRTDNGLGDLPQQSLTTGTYNVTVFGVNLTYDAAQPQTCQQCHGDWHRNPLYNETLYPALSQGLNETLQANSSTNVSNTNYPGPRTLINSTASPGTPKSD
ncbi:MAG: hypothetical protein GWN18_07845, partial [Thermoplasmata archaeon]|nr:hypothetical protein [Thermoplasmata archaeon]NIT79907.1 hypothetical protein [Thermoplasmata archaeon]NIU48985.1 hypothetical protein [Thermoplasmata archaeon]NIV80776.1 hypothetical protein [Thermoplasmata archaeon]NIW82475.1 hypothetical protein [Thermoplasmata archaeon]